MPTTILLVRHGETEANVKGVLQGQSESDLTAKGRAQAMALGRALCAKLLDADGNPLPSHRRLAPNIYASDLRRTVGTGDAIIEAIHTAAGSSLTLVTDERLRERRLGPFQGRTQAQCQRELPMLWTRFCTEEDGLAPSGSEPELPAFEANEASGNRDVSLRNT